MSIFPYVQIIDLTTSWVKFNLTADYFFKRQSWIADLRAEISLKF
jgi:hypothetical protein